MINFFIHASSGNVCKVFLNRKLSNNFAKHFAGSDNKH